jgi:hypothetical protein
MPANTTTVYPNIMKEIGQIAGNRRHQSIIHERRGPKLSIPGQCLLTTATRPSAAAPRKSTSGAETSLVTPWKTGLKPNRKSSSESAETPARRTAIVVRLDGAVYVGDTAPPSSDGYLPGEFDSGVAVPVRFEGDKMFVERPNGKVLETTIVKKLDR